MELATNILSITVYILIVVLLILIIIMIAKLFTTINRTNEILKDLNNKSRSLDGVFEGINNLTVGFAQVSDKLTDMLTVIAKKAFNFVNKKSKNKFNKFGSNIDEEFMEQMPDEDEVKEEFDE